MKRVFSLSAVILGSALIGFGTPAFAGRQDAHVGTAAGIAIRSGMRPGSGW